MENDNLKIWDQVYDTDPLYTKPISGKKYRGTNIIPQYTKKKLTELFGPRGIGWNYRTLRDGMVNGHEVEGQHVILHWVEIAFWYNWDGEKSEEITANGSTFFVGRDKNGWFTEEDPQKKSLTDALTKVVSDLGFSGDIFSGDFDRQTGGSKREPTPKNTPLKKTPPVLGVKCPKCGKEDSIIKSKFKDGEFVCYDKKNNGCGFKFTPKPPEAGDKDDVPIGEPPSSGEYISANDQGKIFAKARSVGWSDDDVKALLDGSYGIKSTKDIPVDKFEEILGYIAK